jgi:predicted phosphodiesterase
MEEGSIWHHEQVIPVSLNSDVPRHFYPICTPPTHSPGIPPSLAPEELGFCTVCADTGEVFHCYKNSLEGWKYRQITAINITAEARELSMHWSFYLWEGQFNLLLLHGADWTNYSWKSDVVLGTKVVFEPATEFGVSHATCAGSIESIFHNQSMHFYFRGTNGMIYECVRAGPVWRLNDVSKQAKERSSTTVVRPAGSDLAVIQSEGVIHIFWIGLDKRLRELYQTPTRGWRIVSLRRLVGGSVCSLPPQSRPFVCVDSDQCLHIFFKNDENRVSECYWKRSRSKWRVYDTSDYIPKHGPIEAIFDVTAHEGPHLFFSSCDVKTRCRTFHHVHWSNNSWVSEYWGTREGIQFEEDYPASPDPLAFGDKASSSAMQGSAPFSHSTSSPTASSSHNGVSVPPPPPPAPPLALVPSAPPVPLKITVKKVSEAKPPLVVRIPMKQGSHTSKLHKYTPVRLIIVSDTHNYPGRVGPLPAGDILVHCGDFTVYGKGPEIEDFATWLDEQTQFKHKVVIAGNHEVNPAKAKKILSDHCIWLDNCTATVMGLNFYGTTWGCDYSQLPSKGIDILLTHKPPLGHGDVIFTGETRGSETLAVAVRKMKPILHAFGHNHEGFGATCDNHTLYVNAATCVGGAKSTSRRGSIAIDIYPDLKSKYGDIQNVSQEALSSSGLS